MSDLPLTGFCEHGRVRTLCPECRPKIAVAAPSPRIRSSAPRRVAPSSAPVDPRLLRAPEARGACAVCKTEAAAKELVQDIEYRQFLCRSHAVDAGFERVLYDEGGRQADLLHPTPERLRELLGSPRITGIRAYRGRAKAPRP